MMTKRFVLAACLLSLSACSSWMGEEEKTPLPGERLSIMQLQKKLEPDQAAAGLAFEAPAPWTNEAWPFAGGYANHAMQHLSLSPGRLKKAWSVDIGAGSTKTNPITAQPVVAAGYVFTLDVDGDVSAFDAQTGKRQWHVFTGARDEDDTVIGGGLGYADDTLFVTNGYAEILALKPDDGAEFWRARLPAPARAAPTVLDGRAYVITLDNRLIALDAKTGTQLWTYRGLSEGAGLLGGASPAATADLVVAAFSSGDLFAFRAQNGAVAWSDNLAPPLRLGGLGALSDIRAMPVVDNGLAIAISYAGRLVAIDIRTGNRIWQRDISGQETPVVAGAYIFTLSTDNQLIALARDTGVIRWVTQLDRFKNPDDRTGRIVWTGPVYAGGRLIVNGTDGRALDIDPANGNVLGDWDTGDTLAVPPLVAREMLYTLDHGGTLTAWK